MVAFENNRRRERELIEIWLRANEGQASDNELQALSQWLEDDADARRLILSLAHHQGWLAWQGGPTPALADSARKRGKPMSDCDSCGPRAAEGWQSWGARFRNWSGGLRRVPLLSMRGALAVMCLAAAMLWLQQQYRVHEAAVLQDSNFVDARIVGGTRCVWDSAGIQTVAWNHSLRDGDSLQLLEGIAELALEHRSTVAELIMEGPAAIVLARQAVPSLRYGKITVATEAPSNNRFPVETPFGRVMLEAGTEVGISAFGGAAEVHVFTGVATVESPWLVSPEQGIVSKVVSAGQALFFDGVGAMALRVAEGPARREGFTPQVSMQSDFLAVGPDYVREIHEASPLAYWRFERESRRSDQNGELVLNDVSDRFHGRLRGKVRWVGPEGNQAIEFGVTPEPGSMVVDESWSEALDGDFTLESWIKASHYHLGSILGFIGEFDWQDRRNKHGILLEVGGTSQPSSIHQPERIRFLHRPKLGVQGGVACFSERPYQPRRWQHIAAVRDGDHLRLYLDGELVSSAKDASRMTLGLQLVLGQLYTETVERFFVGHVDEVAIYDRALKETEIRRHHLLLRGPVKRPANAPLRQERLSTSPVVERSIAHSSIVPFADRSF
jgi:Concanavalin A-like lectin/glucanases superfamily